MPQSSKTIRIVVVLIIAIVILSIVFYGMLHLIRRNVHKASVIEAQISDQLRIRSRDQASEILLENSKPDIDSLESRVISSEGTVSFLQSIEKLAAGVNLSRTVKSVSLEPLPGSESFEYLRINFETVGSFENNRRFLLLLETMPNKIRVSNITLTRQGGAGTSTAAWGGAFSIFALKHK